MGLIICILVNVAFITLIERKILGYSQIRKGPNKVRIIGLIQPFNDAIKLFSKELVIPNQSNKFQFFLSPILGLIIVLIIFFSFPFFEINFSIRISIIFIYIIIRINIYPLLFSGWSSNRKYALLGSLRAVAQTVSCVAETNRTPFDFAEGESELVSGFNIEYGRIIFALIFIAEYASIIFIRIIFSIFFLVGSSNQYTLYIYSTVIIFI